ncbi:class I adenylate-forming enzyme family protein [Natronosalvus halobius]|uniref:class I adenylate-forming enzyme family protein n=1 Tax=Natronosalvus halobius TaxID=2953746 RepID=UPI00209F56DA|nr:class I adenylate-forming enzyme family protein [Natronosalvus halobius]USZ73607.1 acyl--CoA ligase [Natronosalvus halobius]
MGNHLVHHELERQAYWRGDETGLVFEGDEYTFREFNARVNQTVKALRDIEVDVGDRIVVHGHNHGDLHTLFFACSKLGAVYSTISTFQSRSNVEHICETLDPAAVFYTADEDILSDTFPDVRAAAPDAEFVSLDDSATIDDPTLDELVAAYDGSRPAGSNDHDAEDLHNIFWTSGTTGRPKGVLRDHKATLHFNDNLHDVFPFGPENVRLTTNDMMFAAPYLQYGLPTVASGTTNVVLRTFDPDRVYELYKKYNVTVMMLVFTQGTVLLDYLEERDREISLRAVHGVVPTAKRARELAKLTDELYQIFATTESGLVLVNRLTEPYNDPPVLGRPGRSTDARLLPPGETEIPNTPPKPGDIGELITRGDALMTRYLSDEKQHEYVTDGWFHTGDGMRVTESGDLVFEGRIDDRIRSGGINIYPAEVEAVLLKHPNVVEAVVVGVDDDTWGQRVCALVVTQQAVEETDRLEAELDDRCQDSEDLTSEMRPKSYAFTDSTADVPTGAVNKIDRKAVSRRFFE